MKSHRFFQILIIALVFLIGAQQVAAQGGKGKGRLQGIVSDEEGKPIASARVVLDLRGRDTAERETTTNAKGEWAIIGLGSGNWQITVSAEGFVPDVSTVFVSQIERNPKVVTKLKRPELRKDAVIADEASLAYLDEARKLFNEKDYDKSLAILEQFYAQNPKAYQVQLLIGDCYREKGEIDKAIEIYTKAVEESRSDEKLGKQVMAKGLAAIGDCFLRKNDLEKAQDYFKQSVDADPEDEVIAYNVGEIYFSNQKLDEAIVYFTKATTIKPDWSAPYYKLGLISLNKADYEKAKSYFQKFLTLEPEGELAVQAKNILETIARIKD